MEPARSNPPRDVTEPSPSTLSADLVPSSSLPSSQRKITNYLQPSGATRGVSDLLPSPSPTTPVTNHTKGETVLNSIKVTQINLHRRSLGWGHLLSTLAGTINPAIMVTEPPTTTEHFLTPTGNDVIPYYCKLGKSRPRAAILVHRSMDSMCFEIPEFTSPDSIAIKVSHGGQNIILASLYMDVTQSISSTIFNDLSSRANDNTQVFICADTNAHHVLWGNKDTNNRGEDLLDALNSSNLTWANRGKIPTFFNSRAQQSIIDLTITNDSGLESIYNWHVAVDKVSNSDHRYIHFDIKIEKPIERTKVRLLKHTNWDAYSSRLMGAVNKINPVSLSSPIEDIHSTADALENAITQAFNNACPITFISNRIKKPPWLTPDVEQARQDVRRKLMSARKSKCKANLERLKACNRKYSKTLSKAKQQGWRKYCEATESLPESARMHNIIKTSGKNKEKLENVYNSDGNLTASPEETLDVMTSSHFPKEPDGERDHPPPSSVPADLALLEKIYSPDRLKKAVFSFEPDKAPGPDGIKAVMLQKAWPAIKDHVRSLMITNHNKQSIPRPWRESSAIFLAKPGKKDYCDPKSFRTITLSPIFLKLQEKVILWHMQHDLGINDCISKRQFGFKSGSSTESALHKVAHKIERRIAKKGFVLGTFLDIEGAFDNVSFAAIAEALHKTTVDMATCQWIVNMISNRYVTIKFKNTLKRIRVRRGCPQGGVLSPFLWNLVVNDLLTYSSGEIPGHLQAFADDLISLEEGDDTSIIWYRTQKTIEIISRWCKSKGLKLSALKTKVVMFTWNRKWSIRPIYAEGNLIELSPSAKLLGVTLDSKLNFNEHVNNITNKATKYLMQAKRAVGPTWGLTPKVCKWLYTTVVRPILSYCASIWVRALDNKSNATKLARVQGRAMRLMTGSLPSTPFKSLDHITETPNIIHYLKGEAAKGSLRLKGYDTWTRETPRSGKGFIKSHVTINNSYITNLDLPPATTDLMKPVLVLDRCYSCSIPDVDNSLYRSSIEEFIGSLGHDVITCYTDGSETESGTGGGFIITNNRNLNVIHKSSFKLPDYCNVFQAELTAITEASRFCSENYRSEQIEFFSDSLSSLQSLKGIKFNSKTVLTSHEAISKLASTNKVSLNWVPAHSGIWGNEEADTLAKEGTSSTNLLTGYLPLSFVKKAINDKVAQSSQADWIRDPHEHTTMMLGPKSHTIISNINKLMINSRSRYRTAVHLITGHLPLNKHLCRIQRAESDICPKCLYDIEDVSHFLGRCPFYSRLRGEYFGDFYMSASDIFESIGINKIVDFALKSRRFELEETKDKSGVT